MRAVLGEGGGEDGGHVHGGVVEDYAGAVGALGGVGFAVVDDGAVGVDAVWEG